MTLLSLWRSDADNLRTLTARQVLALAGDGRLLDGSACSIELRTYLAEVEADDLGRYVLECLGPRDGARKSERGFEDSGLVLQDVVNEIGRRLDYDVIDGVYRGTRGTIGHDGVWRDGSGRDLLVEVKTTDAYTIRLETIEGYRRALVEEGALGQDSSVLFVVGRDDTGALEAQIRGSPYAWMMRMIGAASLMRLLQVKVNAEAPAVVDRIRSVLRPIEYTRVDRIVDLMFDVRVDADTPTSEQEPTVVLEAERHEVAGATLRLPSSPASGAVEPFRRRAAELVSEAVGARLTQRRRSWYESPDGARRAVIAVSKRYERDYQSYWYAFYDTQRKFLGEGESAWLALCALDTERIWAIPAPVIENFVSSMNFTERPDGQTYWHVLTKLVGDRCLLVAGDGELDLSPYEVSMPARST
ncbi:hypothetical protein FJW04_19155 [Mesorhizobium sp. B2-7-3]|uniref:hypothetical protein n=1 Tax=Mesorhizobium sp. B2-7-3 TaxID=2589907 RepID=UPI001127E7C3|nr:hypothetical protein [Mesorhizobium sp. B2-7-3]TPJ13732.1 hypothetical protein FJW04_19155 [Mesorhizobium sp. B2-7-3]